MFKFSSDTGDKKRRPGRTASRTVRSGGARRVSVAPKNRGLSWVDRVDWGKARIAAVVAIFCVLWLGLWGRAWYLQMIEGPRLADKARRQHMATELVTGKRGMIMDRNGQVLARSVEARSVYARPQEIQDFLTMANTLGPILGIEPQKLYDELSKTKRRFVWVRRKVDDYTAEAVRKAGLPGIGLSKEYDRVYPFKHLAGQLLGFVGVDDKGLEGLERSLDDRLAGTPTRMVVQRDAMGRRFYLHEEGKDELRGEDLMLTLDVQLQFIAEEAVARAARDFDARWSGALVVDVPSGDILAWAQYPFFNPNTYRQSSPMIYRNRLASDALEPGSTFKPITLATGLDTGAVTVNDTYECTGSYKFEGRDQVVSCWKAAGHGSQTTMEALGNSCNIAFSNMGLKIGAQTFYEYFEAFGFREKTGIDLPGEAAGLFFPYEQFTQVGNNANLISSSWGQTFKITPIQLVRATAALVNGGYLLEPHVVKEVLDADGNVVSRNETKVIRQVISQETSDIMCQMYEYVVSGGTASGAQVPGYRIGGKTGTSEKIDVYDENGVQVEDKMVSFIGIAPMEDPKYVVLVVLDTPSEATGLYISGGIMAAPTVGAVFGDILPYLGVEPNYTDEELELVNVEVPNVVGMTEAEAAAALQEERFTYRTVGTGATVQGQIPAAGSMTPGKSEVVLYFGQDAPTDTVEVPDFSGMTLVYAQQYAESKGLYLLVTGTNQDRADVTATYQDVEPGTEVPLGTTITVEFTNHSAQD